MYSPGWARKTRPCRLVNHNPHQAISISHEPGSRLNSRYFPNFFQVSHYSTATRAVWPFGGDAHPPARRINLLSRAMIRAAKRFLLLSGAAVCAAPYILSSQPGLNLALGVTNALAGGVRLDIASVSLGWNAPVDIRDVMLFETGLPDAENEKVRIPLLHIPHLSSSAPLWSFLVPFGVPSVLVAEDPVVDFSLSSNSVPDAVTGLERLGLLKRDPPRLKGRLADLPGKEEAVSQINHDGDESLVSAQQDSAYRWSAETAAFSLTSLGAPEEAAMASGTAPKRSIVLEPDQLESSAIPEWLQTADATVPFTGELVSMTGWPKLRLLTTTGALRVPSLVAPVLEPRVHVEVLLGHCAQDNDDGWQPQAVHFAGIDAAAGWNARVGRLAFPMSIRLDSPNLHCSLRGWGTAKGYTLITEPLRAEMQCHPELARRLFSGLNPLLGAAVRLERRSSMVLTLAPQAGLLPASAWHLRLETIEVDLAQGAPLLQILEPLQRYTGRLPECVHAKIPALEAVVEPGRMLSAGRTDIDLGIDQRRKMLQLVLWGSAHADADVVVEEGDSSSTKQPDDRTNGQAPMRLSWAVAIPGDTLRTLGISEDVDPDRGLSLQIGGTTAFPQPSLAPFAANLLQLYLISQSSHTTGGLSSLIQWLRPWIPGGAAIVPDKQAIVRASTVKLPPRV